MPLRIAILGGGIAGVVLARELARLGARVVLIEKEPRLGGLHRSVTAAGRVFDIGAFVFGERHDLLTGFPFLRPHFARVPWSSISIRPGGRVDRYPISISGYAREVGAGGLWKSAVALARAKLRGRAHDSVRAYACYYMGEEIYRRSGLEHYIERLYDLPDHEVGIEFARQRLPDLPRFTLSRVALRSLARVPHRLLRRPVPGSFAFVRPAEGFGSVYERIGEHLEQAGVSIHLDRPVRAVQGGRGDFEIVFDGHSERCDRVVSTIPIPAAQKLIGLEPRMDFDVVSLYSLFYAGRLRHRAPLQHNFTLGGRWKRLIAFSALYGPHEGLDYWTAEVTTRDTSPAALDGFRRDFEEHAGQHGVFDGAPAFLGGHVTANAYPVFHHGDSGRVAEERRRLTARGIDHVGRQGAFEYLSSQGSAESAARLAKELGRDAPARPIAGPTKKVTVPHGS